MVHQYLLSKPNQLEIGDIIQLLIGQILNHFSKSHMVLLFDLVQQNQSMITIRTSLSQSIQYFSLPFPHHLLIIDLHQLQSCQQSRTAHSFVFISDLVLDIPFDLLQIGRVSVFSNNRSHSNTVHPEQFVLLVNIFGNTACQNIHTAFVLQFFYAQIDHSSQLFVIRLKQFSNTEE